MELEVVNVIVNTINQVGFPIAMATYLIVVLNKSINENTKVMTTIVEKLDMEITRK